MLFFKECRRIVFSKIYVLFFIAVYVISFHTQFWSDMALGWQSYDPPQPGGTDYGMVVADDPEALTQNATEQLLNDFVNNRYTTYPYGFIHVVHLKSIDKDKMTLILTKITGFDDPEGYVKQNCKTEYSYGTSGDDMYNQYSIPDLNVLDRVSVEDFRALMTEADKILGGGSDYAPEEIDRNFSLAPMTYEQALAEYNELVYDDKVTNGYARLFCDYHGTFMALFPLFLIAVYLTADRRSKMEPLIFSRSVSSAKLTLVRFAALVATEMLPVLVTAVMANIRVAQFYDPAGLDWFAMFKYSIIWILPTVIAVTGADMLLMNIIHPIAVVLIHFIVWFFMSFMGSMSSYFGVFDLIIRHNTEYERQIFIDQLPIFTANRLFFTGVGLVCALCTVFVWKLRREGKLGGSKVRSKLSAD